MKVRRELRELLEFAKTLGYVAEWTRKCHLKLVAPNGRAVIVAGTPSDGRSLKNAKSDLRRTAREGEGAAT